jgi:hypothetical protein
MKAIVALVAVLAACTAAPAAAQITDPNPGRLTLTAGVDVANHYELAGEDHAFGFLSAAATASVPLGAATQYGAWAVRGTVEFQALGDTPEAFNGGDQSKLLGSVGITLTY